MQATCNLDTVSPLRVPSFSLFLPLSTHPHDTLQWLKGHPSPHFKSTFPIAARSAECCCLLCTQKFAEAVSCPQTSAPWSGAQEERQGLDWCACCSAPLCQNVWICMCACVRMRVNNYSNRCFVSFLSALLAAPRKPNTYLCNCTQNIQTCIGTRSCTHRCASFLLFLMYKLFGSQICE